MKVLKNLVIIWDLFDIKRKYQFILILTIIFTTTIAEVISIGLIYPILTIITQGSNENKSGIVLKIENLANIKLDDINIIIYAFIASTIIAGLLRLLVIYSTGWFAFVVGSNIGKYLYTHYIEMNYEDTKKINSSEIIDNIVNQSDIVIYNILVPIVNLITSIILISGITLTIMLINPKAFIFTFGFFLSAYILIIYNVKSRLIINGKKLITYSSRIIKILQESFGNKRDILLDGNQNIYINEFHKYDLIFRKIQFKNQFMGLSPRYIIEMIGMVVFSLIILLIQGDEFQHEFLIPTLGVMAICAQRLMPIMQQGYASWASMSTGMASLDIIANKICKYKNNEIITSNEEVKKIDFREYISLKNVTYSYGNNILLDNICIEIKAGTTVGIVGKTGEGKSTLLDIIMGLIPPKQGNLSVDGEVIDISNKLQWMKNISHVPQSIFLIDDTVAGNVSMGNGLDHINTDAVVESLKIANIIGDINKMDNGLETMVGENGIRLSGGQKQRLGIARAIYKNSDILVLDEATSSLDDSTEKKIMSSIKNMKNKTMIIVAHRLSTLSDCDAIFHLSNGKLIKYNNIEEYKKSLI